MSRARKKNRPAEVDPDALSSRLDRNDLLIVVSLGFAIFATIDWRPWQVVVAWLAVAIFSVIRRGRASGDVGIELSGGAPIEAPIEAPAPATEQRATEAAVEPPESGSEPAVPPPPAAAPAASRPSALRQRLPLSRGKGRAEGSAR